MRTHAWAVFAVLVLVLVFNFDCGWSLAGEYHPNHMCKHRNSRSGQPADCDQDGMKECYPHEEQSAGPVDCRRLCDVPKNQPHAHGCIVDSSQQVVITVTERACIELECQTTNTYQTYAAKCVRADTVQSCP